jgi:hypothetical protein
VINAKQFRRLAGPNEKWLIFVVRLQRHAYSYQLVAEVTVFQGLHRLWQH